MAVRSLFKYLFTLTIATCFCVVPLRLGAQGGPAAKTSLQPQPIATPGFPTPTKVVDGWVNTGDATAVRSHGWALWQGISSITPQTQGWPVWETWYTDTEVSAGPPSKTAAATQFSAVRGAGRPVNSFIQLRQFRHARLNNRFASPLASLSNGGEQVIGFNKFNVDYSGFVWKQGYYVPANLWKLEGSWPANTPAAARIIQPFPAPSVGLKPVFEVVRGPSNSGGITVLPYWKGDLATGPSNSTNPSNPTPSTWKQCVVVNTGTAALPAGITCPNGGAPTGIVGRDQFYNFQLNKAEAASICKIQPDLPCTVKEGDYAVLVAMHMTTKEDSNWTWQTFWWNYNQPFPYGAPPATVQAPFSHYAMCSAYSMTVNPVNNTSGKNVTCYNPYLETGLSGVNGIQSNCMTCHAVASVGTNANSPGYPTFTNMSDFISAASPADAVTYFDCQTQTDFSWYMAVLAGSPPSTQPACTVPKAVVTKTH